jgi:hypothetical protein
MSPRARHILAFSLLSLPFGAQAAEFAYAAGFDTLYRINLDTRQAERLGTFSAPNATVSISDLEGLAFAPDGTLYGVSDSIPGGGFVRINTGSAQATIIGNLGLAGQGAPPNDNLDFGLAATCDGRLWLSSDTASKLWEVNPATGATRLVGQLGARISGLAARPDGLYGISVDGDEGLYRINTTTAATTRIGGLGVSMPDAGLDFDSRGRLWGVFDLFPPVRRSDLAQIDPATAQLVSVGRIQGPGLGDDVDSKELEALAIAPCQPDGTVPPPAAALLPIPAGSTWSWLVLGFGLLALAFTARRRFLR